MAIKSEIALYIFLNHTLLPYFVSTNWQDIQAITL